MSRRSLWLTLGMLLFFTAVVVLLYFSVLRTVRYEHAVRNADLLRALVVRLQLDEETGLRGYTSTGRTVFLQPYVQASRRFGTAFISLQKAAASLHDAGLQAPIAAERELHQRWIDEIARPLTVKPRNRRAPWLQLRGKFDTDQFRAQDDRLQRRLQKIAQSADDDLARALGYLVVFGILVEAGILTFGVMSGRAEERANRQRQLYESEKRIADSFQTAFSQPSLPLVPPLGLHGSYLPAEEQISVGGDWYDAFVVREGELFFTIGDVTGHGIEAAVTMSRVRQSLIVGAMRESDPATILRWTNETLFAQSERIVTAICGFVDLRTLEVRYATAGHPPPVLARVNERARFVRYGGVPLGVEKGSHYQTFVEQAEAGSLLVLYTDGLIEYKRNLDVAEAQLLQAAEELVRAPGRRDPTIFIRERFFSVSAPADDVAVLAITFGAGVGSATRDTRVDALQLAGEQVS